MQNELLGICGVSVAHALLFRLASIYGKAHLMCRKKAIVVLVVVQCCYSAPAWITAAVILPSDEDNLKHISEARRETRDIQNQRVAERRRFAGCQAFQFLRFRIHHAHFALDFGPFGVYGHAERENMNWNDLALFRNDGPKNIPPVLRPAFGPWESTGMLSAKI